MQHASIIINSNNVTQLRNVLFVALTIVGFISLHAQQRGKASFYSRRATGARTSSGDRLHHDSLTCAHRTLPFGTLLKITNLSNGKEVVVRVNDRGPFGRGRIVDLSWGAAKALDMLSKGVVNVEVTPVKEVVVPFKDDRKVQLPHLNYNAKDEHFTFSLNLKRDSVKQTAQANALTNDKIKDKNGKGVNNNATATDGKHKDLPALAKDSSNAHHASAAKTAETKKKPSKTTTKKDRKKTKKGKKGKKTKKKGRR